MTTELQIETGAAVRIVGLRKSFGAVTAVDGVDLTVAPGEVVALLGPDGAGKTTTIEMILGLRTPDAGSATIFGVEPREAVRTGRIGAMMQSGGLLGDVKVREVVDLVAAMYTDPLTAERALELAGIADLGGRLIKTLSGGQRQRVLFALAVVPDPDLIVLDEPTVGMDVESRRAFWSSMRLLVGGGRSIVFATHYLDEADAIADRIVLMARGRVVADGPATAIKATVDVRRIRARFPIDDSAPQWLQSVAHVMPTYWITQITRAPISHQWPAATGWLVLLAWALVAARVAGRRYSADDVRAA